KQTPASIHLPAAAKWYNRGLLVSDCGDSGRTSILASRNRASLPFCFDIHVVWRKLAINADEGSPREFSRAATSSRDIPFRLGRIYRGDERNPFYKILRKQISAGWHRPDCRSRPHLMEGRRGLPFARRFGEVAANRSAPNGELSIEANCHSP